MPNESLAQPRRDTMIDLRRSLFGTIVGVATLAANFAHADPVKIRVAYVVPITNWAPMLVAKIDLAKHAGKSYTLEAVRYQGSPPMISALANGELEIADLAYSSFGLAVRNAGIDDLRIISDEFQDGIPGYYSNQFFVLKDGPIKTVKDLKGKIVATNAAGSAIDIGMKMMLRKAGLEEKRDYTVIEAPFPAMAAMLLEKKVDMISAVPPFAFNPMLVEAGRVIGTQADGLGPSQMLIWTARKSFIEKNRAAMIDFMEDVLRIVTWYLDPKNHDEVAKIASQITKAPPERFNWLFTKNDYFRAKDMMPDLKALQSNIDATRDFGIISESLDVQKYSDLSILKEALERVK